MVARSMLEAMPIAAVFIGEDNRIRSSNEKAQNLLKMTVDGRHYVTVLRQPSLLDQIESTMSEGISGQVSFNTTEAGRDVVYEVHLERVVGGPGRENGVLLSFMDVKQHEEAGQMRSDFVANVSHELRTPLTALTGFIETLRGPARDDVEARDRFLGIMEAEGKRMNRLVSDLLSLSRVEDMARIRPTDSVDVLAVLQSVRNALSQTAETKGVTISIESQIEPPVQIAGDLDQLAQVFTNLIENALKYGRLGGGVSVVISRMPMMPAFKGPAICVSVKDDGPGIAEHHLSRLTERFYRVDNHRSRELGGTGLGLAIVKHIINRHRGRLRIESDEGQGSKFSVLLRDDL
ncbi:two-component system, OmpR family, phosphate regulon sensor histidine kinase PhoR [Aliiroseovarius halocynthiae]|uniref:histidine kinase n=1 Tax=Aliiroseovarius halocynthiae TaxID=985055 RepID=A0A545SVY0_9RHOB|nr:ATP-binding protein [Aliiroseovarius halocynthiae]TQV69122.1 two-component sensor histidine kinase [Aliiroseovarius halocynthiae]SMR71879.1 two-component system, OmpR family, phosphate regulon sensor histidine kinase PhoR [Aliiroseovarius halocynthiae]